MNQQQFEEMLRGGMGAVFQARSSEKYPLLNEISQERLYELVREFIERCYNEKGYCAKTLYRDIRLHLQGNPNPNVTTCISEVELAVLPVVLKELEKGV